MLSSFFRRSYRSIAGVLMVALLAQGKQQDETILAQRDVELLGERGLVFTTHLNLLLAHMVFMVLGWMILAPFAILIARFGKTYFSSKWFPSHRGIQMIALASVLIGFIMVEVKIGHEHHFLYKHNFYGMAITIAMVLQCVGGQVAHLYTRGQPTGLFMRVTHVLIGLALTALAFYTTVTGFQLFRASKDRREIFIGIYTYLGIIAVIFAGGLVLLRREFQKKPAIQEEGSQDDALSEEDAEKDPSVVQTP